MTQNSYVALGDRGLITVGGPDRRDFLQGLISNDIEQAGPGQAIWAALLTAQGSIYTIFSSSKSVTCFISTVKPRV